MMQLRQYVIVLLRFRRFVISDPERQRLSDQGFSDEVRYADSVRGL